MASLGSTIEFDAFSIVSRWSLGIPRPYGDCTVQYVYSIPQFSGTPAGVSQIPSWPPDRSTWTLPSPTGFPLFFGWSRVKIESVWLRVLWRLEHSNFRVSRWYSGLP